MTDAPRRSLLSRAVTVVVIAIVIGGGAAVIRWRMPAQQVGERCAVYALFRDGSRLAVGSPVLIAGVRVGEVTRLSVSGDLARVEMALRDDVDIPLDSWITKKAESAFGDNFLEIVPGGDDRGTPTSQRIRCGAPDQRLAHVQEGGSTDSALRAIARTMPKVDRGLDTVHDFALDARKWASGPLRNAFVDLDRWLAAGNLDQPIERLGRGMVSFEDGTTRAAAAVHDAKPQIASGLVAANDTIANARKRIGEFKTDLRDGLVSAREGIDRIDPTIDDIRDVVSAVDEGRGDDFKGRLGRLVNDRDLADTLDDLSEGAADAVAGFVRFKSYLGLRVEVDLVAKAPRVYVSAEVRAREDKFYLVELSKDALGALPGDTLSDNPAAAPYTRTQSIGDNLRFTLQFGKTLWKRVQLRGGIKESTVGFGADAWVLSGRLKLSADLFGSFQTTPRAKLTGALRVFRSIYILAGVDDALNPQGTLPIVVGPPGSPPVRQFDRVPYGRDIFLGAALQFDDADLSTLLRIYGGLVVGLLATSK